MNFSDIYLNNKKPVISFEIFPPKTEKGMEKLKSTLNELVELSPDFITVTYGAMGTTRDKTIEIASYIKNQLKLETACHITCVGATKDEIDKILQRIKDEGIKNLVALRGDPPEGNISFIPPEGGYSYASDLVEHIRSFESKFSNNPHFGIAIAGYPEKHLEAPSFDIDINNLKKKVQAGADVIITQLFFNNSYYFNYVDKVREAGIDLPIVPGLMPILSAKQIMKITSICGSNIPEPLKEELIAAGDNDELAEEIGVNQCISQVKELIESGVPGIHFYVLNKASHIKSILSSI